MPDPIPMSDGPVMGPNGRLIHRGYCTHAIHGTPGKVARARCRDAYYAKHGKP